MPKTNGILGKKIGMTRVWTDDGNAVGVTAVEVGPCVVLQKKTSGKEGYQAIQVGFGAKRDSRCIKPELGHFKEANQGAFYHVREFQVADVAQYEVGQVIKMTDLFKVGDLVDVSGTSKGKGFQGVMKRHNFRGGCDTHGSMFHRAPGSIGQSAWPSRVVKGRKMPGHMGDVLVTKKNVIVMDIREADNIMLVKGSLPGAKQSLLKLYQK